MEREPVYKEQQHERFGFEFLKVFIDHISVRVAQVQKDFLQHELYKIEFLRDDMVVFEVWRRYTEFAAFYEMIRIKFKNIELQDFPSKWQFFKKITNRMEYFNKMMNKLIRFARDHIEGRQKMITCIVSFVSPQLEIETRKKSTSIGGNPLNEREKGESQGVMNRSQLQSAILPSKKSGSSVGGPEPVLSRKTTNYPYYYIRFEGEYEWKKRFLKINGSVLEIYKDISKNTWENKIELFRIKIEYLRQDPDLFDHFMQKMEFQLEMPKYPENFRYISLYHEYDYKKLLITTLGASEDHVDQSLAVLNEKLIVASTRYTIRDDYEGYFGAIGKVYFAFYEITFTAQLSESDRTNFWLVRLKTSAFKYDTKQVQTGDTKIKQGIIIPISNSFEEFTIELVRIAILGVISEEIKETVYASGLILMNDLLSYTNDTKFEKTFIKLYQTGGSRTTELAQLQTTIRNMSDNSSIYSDSYSNFNDGHVLNYEKMSNKEILNKLDETLDRLLFVVGCICLFLQNMWRNLYFFKYPRLAFLVFTMLAFAFLYADMNNLITFLVVLLCMAILYNHHSIHAIVNELSNKFLTGKQYIHPDFKQPLLLSKSEFKYLKWSGNLQRIKMEHDAQNNLSDEPKNKQRFFLLKKGDNEYKVEQEKQSLYQKFAEVKHTIQQIHSIISGVVAMFEKVGSIYSWADFRRTLYFLIFVIVLLILANAVALRLLGFLFCLHRFKKGYTFYKRHYARNRKLAVEVLSYVVTKSFRELYPNSTDEVISVEELYLPIDEEALKKLKKGIETVLPVVINIGDIIETYKRLQHDLKPYNVPVKQAENRIQPYILNKKIKVAYFIKLIESCQSRLKLEKLIMSEGLSEEYQVIVDLEQKLRDKTRQDPVIDIWIQDMIYNYILNSPSMLYRTIHRTDHLENNLFGKDINTEPIDYKNEAIITNIIENNIQRQLSQPPTNKKKTN